MPSRLLDMRWYDDVAALARGEQAANDDAQLRDALGPFGSEHGVAEPHDVRLERVRALDRKYLAWQPDFPAAPADPLATLQEFQARQRLWHSRTGAQPALPGSAWYRYHTIEAAQARRVLLLEDADGLSLALAKKHDVVVVEPVEGHRRWLAHEAERLGVHGRIRLQGEHDVGGLVDVTVLQATVPAATRAALGRAIASTCVGGRIVLAVHSPADLWVYALISKAHLPIADCRREIEHAVTPAGPVLAGAGDLLVLTRSPDAELALEEGSLAEPEAPPYLALDFHSLAPNRLAADAGEHWLDWLTALADGAPAARGSDPQSDQELLWWYDKTGAGVLANLRRAERALFLVFLPYSRSLEKSAIGATLSLLGDDNTRIRPRRTRMAENLTVMS